MIIEDKKYNKLDKKLKILKNRLNNKKKNKSMNTILKLVK